MTPLAPRATLKLLVSSRSSMGRVRIIADSEGEELDIFAIPNVFVVTSSSPDGGELSTTYVNDNPLSPTSTVKRHRQIVDYREISDIAGIDELDAYIKHIAYAVSSVYSIVSFDTIEDRKSVV